jgi:hypothetical protein
MISHVYCEDMRLWRTYREKDGSDAAIDIGPCDAWPGCGCQWDLLDPPPAPSEPIDEP